MLEVTIPLRSQDEAILVLGPYDRYAKLLRQSLDIELYTRSGNLLIKGVDGDVAEARRRIEHLLGKVRKGRALDPQSVEAILLDADGRAAAPATDGERQNHANDRGAAVRSVGSNAQRDAFRSSSVQHLKTRAVEPRSQNQRRYLEAIEKNSLVFGVGPAGTGKTFLAVAAALRAMRSGACRRLIITRPVVEAGERLGFLPGDFQAKLDPYLRPVYDALSSLMRFEDLTQLEENGVIEIAPLAYMRGRTLAEAFVILDEAQNTSPAQMKMFLTRLGEGSKMVVTGDPSQSDLDARQRNGLNDAVRRLRGFEGVTILEFDPRDIVRHPLVEQIIRAYEGGPAAGEGGDGSG